MKTYRKRLIIDGGIVDIWSCVDSIGNRCALQLHQGPACSLTSWALFIYALRLALYQRWPLHFRRPVIIVDD